MALIVELGRGDVGLGTFRNAGDEVDYGLYMRHQYPARPIGDGDTEVIGQTVEERDDVFLRLHFSKSASVQAMIDELSKIKNSLTVWEEYHQGE